MKQRTVTFITGAGVTAPAMAFAVGVAVHSGVEETKCLQATMEPCSATDLLAVEPDMPVENGGSIPMQGTPVSITSSNPNSGTTVTLGRVVFWQT
jgi:hypothetical protein